MSAQLSRTSESAVVTKAKRPAAPVVVHVPLHTDGRSAGPLRLPTWLETEFRTATIHRTDVELAGADRSLDLTLRSTAELSLASIAVADADHLDSDTLQRIAAAVYGALLSALGQTHAPHVSRLWNFLPAITRPVSADLNRYMSFNLGRFEGFRLWFGAPAAFDGLMPTATAVGHTGHELVVHALGAAQPCTPVENPRQRPAFTYSPRYGPRPPCFSRGAVVQIGGAPRLLVGGTASIRGEETMHEGSLERQLEETTENLSALIAAAAGPNDPLHRIREARVYCPREPDLSPIRAELMNRFPRAQSVEATRADLCRPELLIEVEALVDLDSPDQP